MVTVTPAPSSLVLSGIAVSPATIGSGQTATLTLTLSGPAPAQGVAVSVASGDPSALPALAQYTVPAGQSSASFLIEAGTVTAPLTVAVGASLAGTGQVAMATVLPPAPSLVLTSLDISPVISLSGTTVVLTLTLSGPAPAGGASVSVTSGNLATFPALPVYVIPEGQSSATFGVQVGQVPLLSVVPVTAGYGGASLTAQVFVIQPL